MSNCKFFVTRRSELSVAYKPIIPVTPRATLRDVMHSPAPSKLRLEGISDLHFFAES